jgi:hypothetical protein
VRTVDDAQALPDAAAADRVPNLLGDLDHLGPGAGADFKLLHDEFSRKNGHEPL